MILSSLALVVAQAPGVTGDSPLCIHPEGASFVMAVPDLQAALGALGGTALARTAADEDLHVAIGEVMGGGPVDPVELLVRELPGELRPILELHKGVRSFSMSMDLVGSVQQVVRGLMEEGEGAPDFELRLVVDFEDEASCEVWTGIMREALVGTAPSQVSTRAMSLEGDGGAFGSPRLTVMEISGLADGEGQYLLHGGTRALMAIGIEDLDAELARLSGAAPGVFSNQLEVGRERLGVGAGTPLMELYLPAYAGVTALTDAMGPAAATASMLVGPMATMLELMLGAPGTAMLRGGHWRFSVDEDGRHRAMGWIPGASPIPSLEMVGSSPLAPSSLSLAHPDALVTSVASFAPEQLLDLLVQASNDVSSEELEEVYKGMEAEYGFRIDRDLIEPLGGSISYSLPKLRSLLSAPNLMAAASLDDREAFIRGMDGLMGMMEDAGGADGQRTEYRGAMVYTWSLDALRGGSGGMQVSPLPFDLSSVTRPTVTVMDDRVLISTLPSHAKREVRRVEKLLKAGEKAELHAGLGGINLSADATMVSFADWPTFYGNLYLQLRALAPMMLNPVIDGYDVAGGDSDLPLPFKLESLPDMALLTRHFAPSERSWVKLDDGFMDISVSSLGPEIPALALGIGVTASMTLVDAEGPIGWGGVEPEGLLIEASVPEPQAPPAAPSGAASDTESQLMSLEVAVRMYQLDHDGELPSTLVELTRSEAGKPGYVSGGLRDGWGRMLRYKRTDDGYRAWSLGANALDEEGEGDDPCRIYKSPIK